MNEKEVKNTLRQFDDIPIPNKNKILSNCEAAFAQQRKWLVSCWEVLLTEN